MRATFSGQPSGQHPTELAWLLQQIETRQVRTYLEVGARFGDTLYAVAQVMAPGGTLVAVDLPGAAWGRDGSEPYLRAAADAIRAMGHEVHLVIGDSHDPEVIAEAARFAPYDLALIDADHRFAAAAQDVGDYGPLADAVVLHDISPDAPKRVDVPVLWRALQAVAVSSEMCVAAGSGMGLGLLERGR